MGVALIFLLLVSLFAIITSAEHQLTDGLNTLPYSPVNQCFGAIGQSAEGSHRLYFRLAGVGHCQLLLCYPGQLDPNRISDGKVPDVAYTLGNVPGNMVANYCQKNMHPPANQSASGHWHGIYLEADPSSDPSIRLSICNETFSITSYASEFQLVLGTPDNLYAVMELVDANGTFVRNKEHNSDNELRRQFVEDQYNGALLKDFVGLWTLALDMLPSNPWQNSLELYKSSIKKEGQVCDPRHGEWQKDDCHIEAWFLQPGEKKPHIDGGPGIDATVDEAIGLPKSWQLSEPLGNGRSVLIRGRAMAESSESLEIHLLHNWTEPDFRMAETILFIKVRRKYLNIQSRINASTPNYVNLYQKADIVEDINDWNQFSLKIAIKNGIYKVELNCQSYGLDMKMLLNSTPDVDHIFIEGSMELLGDPVIQNGEKVGNNDGEKMPISYSVELANKMNDADDLLFIRGKFAGEFVVNQSNLLEINLIQYDHSASKHDKRPETAATILVHFLAHAQLQADNETIVFDYAVIGPNPEIGKTGLNVKVKAAEEFRLIFTQSKGVYLNGVEMVGPNGNGGVDFGAINYVQFKGNFLLSQMNETKTPHILKSPFKQFSDLLLYTSGPFFQFNLFCQNATKCPKKDGAFKMEHANGKLTLIGKGMKESFVVDNKIATEPYYEVRVHAGTNDYRIYLNGSFIGNADYRHFTAPEHIDTIWGTSITQEPEIEWKKEDANDLALPFSYMLPKSLEIGSRITFDVEIFPSTIRIFLAHSTPFPSNEHKLGQLVIRVDIVYVRGHGPYGSHVYIRIYDHNLKKAFEKDDRFSVGVRIQRLFGIIVQKEYYQFLLDGNELKTLKHELPVWAVDYVSVEESVKGAGTLKRANITWPSDMTEKWLEPSSGVSLRPPNSWKVFGFVRIELSAELVEKDGKEIAIYFLNDCQEWSEKFCDVVLRLKIGIVPDGEDFGVTFADNGASFSHKNGTWSQIESKNGKDKKFSDKIKKQFKLTINVLHGQFETLALNFSGNNQWHIQKPYQNNLPFWDIAHIHAAGDFAHVQLSQIIFSDKPSNNPVSVKLGRPLRVNDAIQFKLTRMSEGTIKFVYGTSNPDVGKTILTIEIESAQMRFQGIKGKRSSTALSLGLSFEVLIGDKAFFMRNYTNPQMLIESKHGNLFWAIQYIHVHPSLEMEEDYPKIVHNY